MKQVGGAERPAFVFVSGMELSALVRRFEAMSDEDAGLRDWAGGGGFGGVAIESARTAFGRKKPT